MGSDLQQDTAWLRDVDHGEGAKACIAVAWIGNLQNRELLWCKFIDPVILVPALAFQLVGD